MEQTSLFIASAIRSTTWSSLPCADPRDAAGLERGLREFADAAETNARLEIHLAFTGQQLTPTHRESITFTFPSARIATAKRAPKDARTIPEEITLIGETTNTLTPPLTVTVTTTRDWSPLP